MKLEDLFASFSSLHFEEQIAKIKEVRDTRTIERPAVAQRRRKKEEKKEEKKVTKTIDLFSKLDDDAKAALIAKLQKDLNND